MPGFTPFRASISALRRPLTLARILFAYPDAVIDHAAQVLDEVAVDLGRDRADRFVHSTSMRESGDCADMRGIKAAAAAAVCRKCLRVVCIETSMLSRLQ